MHPSFGDAPAGWTWLTLSLFLKGPRRGAGKGGEENRLPVTEKGSQFTDVRIIKMAGERWNLQVLLCQCWKSEKCNGEEWCWLSDDSWVGYTSQMQYKEGDQWDGDQWGIELPGYQLCRDEKIMCTDRGVSQHEKCNALKILQKHCKGLAQDSCLFKL